MWFLRPKSFSPITLTNTLSGKKENFTALRPPTVRLYSCGPTVYGPQHIGNLRAAVFSDTLARTLAYAGYDVQRVINITDVGHMVGDGDEGEDKMSVGAKRDGTTPKEIATRYATQYLNDIRALNINTKHIRFPRATDYIPDQVQMIRTLEKRGHTYTLPDGVYFDTSTFPAYGKLGGRDKAQLQPGARVEMVAGKKHPEDFVLWRKAKPNDLQQWNSPWGKGNPGWSIECSAMIRALLGDTIDIHTGGEDHISVHHNNEIAQSEGSSGKPLARVWMHNAFLAVGGEKISKSLGNTYVLEDITKRGIHPLAFRYFLLQAHYRTPLSFSWEALEASHEALQKLWRLARVIKSEVRTSTSNTTLASLISDDLATPQLIAELWNILQNTSLSASEKWGSLEVADSLLGLSLTNPPELPKALTLQELPTEVRELAQKREEARKNKDFAQSDELRIHIEKSGYRVEDTPSGALFTKTVK